MPLTSLGHGTTLWYMGNYFITGITICIPQLLTAGMPTKVKLGLTLSACWWLSKMYKLDFPPVPYILNYFQPDLSTSVTHYRCTGGLTRTDCQMLIVTIGNYVTGMPVAYTNQS